MRKLFNLRDWLTISDAAEYLSIVFGEKVEAPDVLRLALDGHLRLSVSFINKTRARRGKVVGYEDVEWGEFSAEQASAFPNLPEEARGKPLPYIKSLNIDGERYLNLEREVTVLDGVWDLAMFGAERLDIEHEFQQLTGGPSVTLQNLNGAFVERSDGYVCQLQESFEKPPKSFTENDYYPAAGLPDDSAIVVRTEALREFEQKLKCSETKSNKPIGTTERRTLLVLIAALCNYSDIKPSDRGAASQISGFTAEIGAPISDDTIRRWLKEIPDAIDAKNRN